MKNFLFILTLSLLGASARADQSASWTCEGEDVKLSSETTYVGENSPLNQELFVLEVGGTKKGFFLDIEYDVGRYGVYYISGKNSVGGSFEYKGTFPEDKGDGTLVRRESQGTLTYSQGSSGKVKVNCVLE